MGTSFPLLCLSSSIICSESSFPGAVQPPPLSCRLPKSPTCRGRFQALLARRTLCFGRTYQLPILLWMLPFITFAGLFLGEDFYPRLTKDHRIDPGPTPVSTVPTVIRIESGSSRRVSDVSAPTIPSTTTVVSLSAIYPNSKAFIVQGTDPEALSNMLQVLLKAERSEVVLLPHDVNVTSELARQLGRDYRASKQSFILGASDEG